MPIPDRMTDPFTMKKMTQIFVVVGSEETILDWFAFL
jgi:hypothetical protein